MTKRVFSGIQPTGNIHIGNYLGAIRPWVTSQAEFDNIFCVADLHAITIPQEPRTLKAKIREVAGLLFAAGIAPHILTHVETTAGPVSDGAATPHIHQALARQGLWPTTPIVDPGDLDAELLVTSQREYRVDRLGPMRADCTWQAQAAQGFDASPFQIDGEQQRARCPGGYTSISWPPAVDDRTNEVVKIKFSMKDCQPCANRVHCTRAKRRTITVRRQDHHVALQAARARETSAAYTTEYARRGGIEGMLSQDIRAYGLQHARYIGGAKTHLQHVLTAAAINFVRIGNWLMKKPLAKTRTSTFQKLITQPVCC
jgi:DDE family transposase/tRNA synthetase class I (W and Y)